jgi:hypothetical protein
MDGLDWVDGRGQLAAQAAIEPRAEDRGDLEVFAIGTDRP